MADLREAVSGLGYGDIATLLQSGNVVFTSSEAAGFDVDVVVRTAAQVARFVDANPLADVATDPRRLQVVFLGPRRRRRPSPAWRRPPWATTPSG